MIKLTKRELNKLNTRKAKVAKLNKAWRVFKAENPDAELKRDDEED